MLSQHWRHSNACHLRLAAQIKRVVAQSVRHKGSGFEKSLDCGQFQLSRFLYITIFPEISFLFIHFLNKCLLCVKMSLACYYSIIWWKCSYKGNRFIILNWSVSKNLSKPMSSFLWYAKSEQCKALPMENPINTALKYSIMQAKDSK